MRKITGQSKEVQNANFSVNICTVTAVDAHINYGQPFK